MKPTQRVNNVKAPIVIFLHFPKTAGTTLNFLISREYKQGEIFNLIATRSFPELLNNINEKLKNEERIRLIKGHMGFGLHELISQPCTYITFLRNPIERTISLYYYLRQFEPYRFADTEAVVELAHRQSLKDFCIQLRDNPMTRFFSGADFKTQVAMKTFWSLDNMWLSGIDIPNHEKCSVEMLELAKNNLRKYFSVIGLTERFDESLILLQKELGWNNIYYTVRNVTGKKLKKDHLSKDTLACIEKHHDLDIELYEYAQELFEEKIAKHQENFEKSLKRFRHLNPIFGNIYSKAGLSKTLFKEGFEFSKHRIKALLPNSIYLRLKKLT